MDTCVCPSVHVWTETKKHTSYDHLCPSAHVWTVRSYKTPLLWLFFGTVGTFVAILLICSHTKPIATQEKRHPNLWTKVATRHCFVGPSIRPSEAWNTLVWPVLGSVGPPDQPWPFYGMSVRPAVCPSVRPERFPGICRRTHGENGLKFYMLMYLDHFQNWLVYGYGLLIFQILALFWLSETDQIWGFRAFLEERMEGMAWNFTCWCILTIFRTD